MRSRKVLYKYVSVDRAVQILKNKSIRFSQPDQLNDAFELLPTLNIEELKSVYLAESRGAKSLRGLDDFTLGFTQAFLSGYESVGVLCLSEKFDVPLMWAHYAENYRGVVIGFDIEEGALAKADFIESEEFCKLAKISYSESRFMYPNSVMGPLDYMFHKDICWKYESEWRIVRSLNTLSNIGNDIYVGNFNTQTIRCVIFGPLFSKTNYSKILDVLRSDDYSHVGKYTSHLEDLRYEIDIDYFISVPTPYKLDSFLKVV